MNTRDPFTVPDCAITLKREQFWTTLGCKVQRHAWTDLQGRTCEELVMSTRPKAEKQLCSL